MRVHHRPAKNLQIFSVEDQTRNALSIVRHMVFVVIIIVHGLKVGIIMIENVTMTFHCFVSMSGILT